ncbi:hypothetical protein CHELA1G11_12918 [Hyphomicrobiales bacterium]|nr:hypothetical protein CHELA1G2_11392 [Hyphomicrobiales bacterium]CAH1668033.1 hypothetical protein CHELA1G11_12918 [Hyphomicrobiales bacterium]
MIGRPQSVRFERLTSGDGCIRRRGGPLKDDVELTNMSIRVEIGYTSALSIPGSQYVAYRVGSAPSHCDQK